MKELAGRPYWELSFDKTGLLTDPDRDQFVNTVAASGVSNLFIMSHGWGSSEEAARRLYTSMFPLISTAAEREPTMGATAFAGVFWPSLWFPDPPKAAGSRDLKQVPTGHSSTTGAQIAQALLPSYDDATQRRTIERLGALIDAGTAGIGTDSPEVQRARLREFRTQLQTLVDARPKSVEDSGETAAIQTAATEQGYASLSEDMGTDSVGGADRGLGDIFAKAWNGAKDVLRAASYYEMKGRAGDIGRQGLGPLLEVLHERVPDLRVHLIGHSFGARLVSYSLSGISTADASPVASVSLVQGAFSHWAFAPKVKMPFGVAGGVAESADRVKGPVVATFSVNDWAVGHWYPRASFLSGDNNRDLPTTADLLRQWGGLGADGFQGVDASIPPLRDAGEAYDLTAGFYKIDCSRVIADVSQSPFAGAHSDIEHDQIAWLIVAASRASGTSQAPAV